MEIRSMVFEDYPQCYALWEEAPGVHVIPADAPEGIKAFLEKNPRMSFVACDGNEIAGSVLGGHDGRRGFLYHLAVKPEYRRMGIASRLVDAGINALKAAGIDKCHVFVMAGNATGNAFWASGWTKREDIAVYSKDI